MNERYQPDSYLFELVNCDNCGSEFKEIEGGCYDEETGLLFCSDDCQKDWISFNRSMVEDMEKER